MQLWNIHSKKLIYSFASFSSGITVTSASPALDIVGVGLKDGRIIIHNLRTDQTIVSFLHSEGGSITALSFRSDKKQATLASGLEFFSIFLKFFFSIFSIF